MNIKTKKWLLIAGCLVICAVLVALIGSSFSTQPVQDGDITSTDAADNGVTVSPGSDLSAGDTAEPANSDAPAIVVNPSADIPASTSGGAVSTGTEQTIQPDVTKPEYDEKTLTDPTKTPDGQPVSEPPKSVDHDSVSTPPATEKPSSGGTSGGLPGFDNVPNAGANQGETLDDMYENGNKIGIMD